MLTEACSAAIATHGLAQFRNASDRLRNSDCNHRTSRFQSSYKLSSPSVSRNRRAMLFSSSLPCGRGEGTIMLISAARFAERVLKSRSATRPASRPGGQRRAVQDLVESAQARARCRDCLVCTTVDLSRVRVIVSLRWSYAILPVAARPERRASARLRRQECQRGRYEYLRHDSGGRGQSRTAIPGLEDQCLVLWTTRPAWINCLADLRGLEPRSQV